MPKHAVRKLFLFGRYSFAVLPPKKWLTELGLKRGDEILLELDRKRGRIVIRLNNGRTAPALEPPQPSPKADFPKSTNNDPKSEDSGWEPIPSL